MQTIICLSYRRTISNTLNADNDCQSSSSASKTAPSNWSSYARTHSISNQQAKIAFWILNAPGKMKTAYLLCLSFFKASTFVNAFFFIFICKLFNKLNQNARIAWNEESARHYLSRSFYFFFAEAIAFHLTFFESRVNNAWIVCVLQLMHIKRRVGLLLCCLRLF